jgi:hypothetical protein
MGDTIKEGLGWVASPFTAQADALGVTDLFDPGKNEREQAQQLDAQARQMWLSTLPKDGAGNPIISSSNDESFDLSAPSFGSGADDLQTYGTHDEDFKGSEAAWTDGGSSAFEGQEGASAFGDLRFDQSATDTQQAAEDYFMKLSSGGRDAIADAEYARRAEQAERSRRANTDAAVRSLETQGRGGSGATLLAGLTGAQGEASDRYHAGLDANAVAQARRDAAATSGANIASTRGQNILTADQQRATGMDAWSETVLGGQDAWSEWEEQTKADLSNKNADRDQDARKSVWDRGNVTRDANTAQHNERAWWQGPGKGEALWDRQQGIIGGATGQAGQQAAGLRADGEEEFNWGKAGTDVIAGYAKSQGGG